MKLSPEFEYCPYDGQRLSLAGQDRVQRRVCPMCGYVDYQNPRPCVSIVIARRSQILLARRGVDPAKNKWDFPGGFVDPGESAEDAVVREAFEETGLTVKVCRYLGSVSDVYGERSFETLTMAFLVNAVAGNPTAQDDVAELAWFPLDKVPFRDMAFAHQQDILRWCRTRLP
jgi:mutator protein MutT